MASNRWQRTPASTEPKPGFLVGRHIGACKVLSLIGAGGMGEVYRARDTKLGRDVAIKVLPDALTSDPDRLARLHHEARLLAALNHPHIATIHNLEDAGAAPALIMELVEGPTLAERLATTPLSVPEAIHIAGQLVDALEAAHDKGIVHRDLKPANIKIAPRNTVKILDFGLAKVFAVEGGPSDVSELPTVTAVEFGGPIVGTPAYMSPEQARGKTVDPRTDVWAFGCILYEMLTARPPFRGETVSDTIAAILEREPDWRILPDATPASVQQLMRQCLEKDPQHRLYPIATARRALAEYPSEMALKSWPPDRAINSLAVLPFVNASNDQQMDYLSDGLTETIISSLSQLPDLRVMARNTVFRFKAGDEDAQRIGRTLGVGAVATGRVQQRGDTLIISAELVDVENGWQVWGAQYKKAAADIFATEEEISREISEKLRLKLSPHARKRLAKRYTENVEAYHLYLKGKFSWAKRTREAMSKGLEYFRQAIDLDPTYALAYAGIAASYAPMIYYCYVPPKEGALKGKAAARKALEVEPELPEARTVLAVMKTLEDRDYAGAAQDLREVIESDPNYAWARQLLAEVLTVNGHFEQAFRETERALEIDPLSLPLNAFAAQERYYARLYGEAIEQCLRTIEMEPNFHVVRSILGMAYGQQGRFAEAVVELRQAERLSNSSPITLANLGAIHAVGGQEQEARTILRELEAPTTAGQYLSPTLRAFILAGLGDKERALSCLEQACEERDPQLVWMKVDPRFDKLRAETRFQAVLGRMGLA